MLGHLLLRNLVRRTRHKDKVDGVEGGQECGKEGRQECDISRAWCVCVCVCCVCVCLCVCGKEGGQESVCVYVCVCVCVWCGGRTGV
jgi:hypothetical protein